MNVNVNRALLAALCLALGVGGCRCDSFRFYEVTRTPVDECDILPQGEFCNPEGLSAPTFEIWAIEHRAEEVRVVVDEEVWIADPADPENPARVTASKLEVDTVEPGPCTTTTTRSFDLIEGQAPDPTTGVSVDAIAGQLLSSQRLTGPDDCGETPRGLRSVADLVGLVAGAP